MTKPLGLSGRIAHYFQSAQITPLLALVALLLGIFALIVTPREEEPQINVTMANVLIPFPGASAKDVEQMVSTPAEQVLSQIQGIEHVYSISRPGMSIITVQYKVGVPRIEALVRLYDTVNANADWLPSGLGVLPPIIKPKGIDDVPIVALTLYSKDPHIGSYDLERVAHSIEVDIKRVAGTREVKTIGGPGRVVNIQVDAARLNSAGLTISDLQRTLASANVGAPLGHLLINNQSIQLETSNFLTNAQDVSQLIVGVHGGRPIYLSEVAQINDNPPIAQRYVWYGKHNNNVSEEYPAVTVSVTKKPGENAIDVANAVMTRVESLKNTIIPANVIVAETRNYGATANDKAKKLIEKLLFATSSVVALVFFALGRREALIVGSAVILTLTVTLFASWAWGFTLNRVSLFALIFSIGILVDDAIVVVENIHRHQLHHPDKTLLQLIPGAVDEVGGPTILATLTVIAALLPMAFVTGLMGPYMSPIPINASMGMLLSLAIAFIVTPWLSRIWLKPSQHQSHSGGLGSKLHPWFVKIFTPLLDEVNGKKNRKKIGFAIGLLILISLVLPATGLVLLKMLPFDNKSEFQVMVDMPAGTSLEETAAVMHELGAYLAKVPEVVDYQAYVGTASPINFNGLVRQYYLRSDSNQGDIQVNLVDKHHRDEQSHAIATRIRPQLQKIGRLYNANIKVVEVPPGPPVLSPIVAEVYGPSDSGRLTVAKDVRDVFSRTPNVVDVDDSSIVKAPKKLIQVDRRKAALYGVSQQQVVSTLQTALSGQAATWFHDQRKYPAAAWIQMSGREQGDLGALLHFSVHGSQGQLIPLSELVTITDTVREQPIFHKDLLPVNYVVGDMAGKLDSPLYGMFKMRSQIHNIRTPNGEQLVDYFIHQPADPYRHYAIKWDGEWQVTYETFRDMGAAYAVGLILIYLLVVAQFGSYLTPLIIMAPIPLTIIGVMPGHALLGAQYTATSMIGMIALAGIIVRNSILLVDFINLQVAEGVPFKEAIIHSAVTRAQPILLTGLAAMLGAFFILDDPIFNGLAISLIFGIFVSTLLTLIVIPTLYYAAYHNKFTHSNNPSEEITQ
ncbi:MAG: efflux RND transporter permease subunit [Betaproteobacteria bacterium]|nr:efflux RND transporter permease subunit [Betaproteobacteria bacterium]